MGVEYRPKVGSFTSSSAPPLDRRERRLPPQIQAEVLTMRRPSSVIVFALVLLLGLPLQAGPFRRGHVKVFAVLPDGSSGPEGLEVDSAGNVYVTTFGFTAKGSASGPGQLFVFNANGVLLRQ